MFSFNILKIVDKAIFTLVTLAMLLSCNCATHSKKLKIVIEEKTGISRGLEYVQIDLPSYLGNSITLEEIGSDKSIHGEKLNKSGSGKESGIYIFPVSINAYEKKSFFVNVSEKKTISSALSITGEGIAITIENDHFIADFSIPSEKELDGLYPGQLSTLFLKKKQVLFERDENNIHWSPNFQKEGLEYKTIGHLDNKNTRVTENNDYIFSMVKSGNVKGYEEIDLIGQYTFYSNLPYFIYSSSMLVNKNVTLTLLRNDEMTMNKLFTHIIYPNTSGTADYIPLYNNSQLDSLAKSPLSDNIPWIGFVNKELEYGLLSIRLTYDNSNLKGKISPLHNPHTKISLGANEGRYWNRRLINDHITQVPKGSRYYELNAYLVIDGLEDINGHIEYYKNCIQNPLKVSYH